jgi:hypothetical protein
MKYVFIYRPPLLEVLDDDPFEHLRSHPAIPYPFRIYDDDRTLRAYAEARRFTALYAGGAEKKILSVK